jgi:hypothetical protein
VETQAHTVLTLGLDRINKFVYRLDGPLGEGVMYSSITQNVFRLDKVKSSSFDCPSKIPVDVYSNARCFTYFSSGRSSPKVAEFCLTLRLVYFIART